MKKTLSLLLAIALVFAILPSATVVANTVLRMSPTDGTRHAPTINGWNIEAWTDTRLPGRSTMTVNANGGAFTCEWNNTYNTLFRTGRKFSPMPAVSTLSSASIRYDVRNFWSGSGATYLCVYGWTDGTTGNNTTGGAIIEWYVIDGWRNWHPGNATGGTYQHHGTMTANGSTYDIISAWRIDQPWVGPGSNGTFLQLFNIRRNSEITGTTNTNARSIDMAAHFRSWVNLGAITNPQGSQRSAFTNSSRLYEISFTLEGYGGDTGSSGSGDVRNLCLTYSGLTTRLCTWDGCTNCTGGGTTTATTTSANPTHGISLSQTSTLTFPSRAVGYGEQEWQSITVTNTGNQPTGPLTIAAPTGFSIQGTTGMGNGIPAGGTRTFDIRPSRGLTAGTYSGAVTVSGGANITSRSFNVSFSVTGGTTTTATTASTSSAPTAAPTRSIALSQTMPLVFLSAAAGYGEQTWTTITVTNTGNQPTGALTIEAPEGFSVQGRTGMTAGIAVGGTQSFDIRPSRGLSPGTYGGAVTVSGTGMTSQTFNVSFAVTGETTTTAVTTATSTPTSDDTPTTGTSDVPNTSVTPPTTDIEPQPVPRISRRIVAEECDDCGEQHTWYVTTLTELCPDSDGEPLIVERWVVKLDPAREPEEELCAWLKHWTTSEEDEPVPPDDSDSDADSDTDSDADSDTDTDVDSDTNAELR